MIIDRLENARLYPFGELWEAAVDFLESITPETEIKQHIVRGKDLYVDMAAYNTKPREEGKVEGHIKYVDVQFVISGEEAHEIYLKDNLTASTGYNTEKDATFYHIAGEPHSRITLRPGYFAAYFPHDAHMAGLMSGNAPQPVKKAVVKVAFDLLNKG